MIHMSSGSIPQQETIIHMNLEAPRNLLRLINKTFAVLGVSKARSLSAALEAALQESMRANVLHSMARARRNRTRVEYSAQSTLGIYSPTKHL